MLRTSFVYKHVDHPLQIVHRRAEVPIEHHDLRLLSPSDREQRLQQFLADDRGRPFSLETAPLVRLAVLQLEDDVHEVVFTSHHMLLDGWSLPLLLKDVFACYESFLHRQTPLLESRRPYRDYLEWMTGQDLSQAKTYWQQTLSGFTATTSMPADPDSDRQPASGLDYAERARTLSESATERLQDLARQHQLTLNTLVQGTWALLLSHYSRSEDVVFGTTVAGRPADLRGSDSMIGLFINTLPVRVRFSRESRLLPWLQQLQADQATLRQFDYSPLSQVQAWSDVPRDTPLFETLVVFENYPVDSSFSPDNQDQSLRILEFGTSIRNSFPFTVRAVPGTQKCCMTGMAQWCPVRIATPS